ncbi:MAG: hypothetical protein U1C71_03620, partial [archaeon]|nr:hypothetical protein [archaeon]
KTNKVEVDAHSSQLRVTGSIESGSPGEFVELHAMHSLVFGVRQPIAVKKTRLPAHEIERLRQIEADSKKAKLVCVVLDDEEAVIVEVSGVGVKESARVKAYRSGKQYASQSKPDDYFSSIADILQHSPVGQMVIAGPGFTRQSLLAYLQERFPKGDKQFLSIPTHDTGMSGVKEAIASEAIAKAVGEYAMSRHAQAVDEVMRHLGKEDGLATYGFKQVEYAVEVGAASRVLVSQNLYDSNRERVDIILALAKRMGIPSPILDSDSDPGKQLDGLGGIAAILRYRVEHS